VRPEQSKLQLLGQLFRNHLRDEAAKPGVDAVGVLVRAVRDFLHDLPRRAHLLACLLRKLRRRAALDGNRPNVPQREIVACQRMRHGHS